MKTGIKSKVRIHIYMLYEINNNYFRTKNPNLDRKLDRNLRILDTDGRGLSADKKEGTGGGVAYVQFLLITFLVKAAYARPPLSN